MQVNGPLEELFVIPLKVPISPYILFLWKRRKVLLIPGMERYGFLDILADNFPKILHRCRMIFENSSISLLPNGPHEEARNELP